MRERTVQFGADGSLSGILTEPDSARPGAPGVVLSNVGMHTRIGPSRMWVELARTLAAQGLLVLRFDQSGYGDSEVQASTLNDLERASAEQRAAVDLLTDRRGQSGAVLVGFCSGVDGAHLAATADERVRGVVHLDGYAYPTRGHFLRYWTLRLFRGGTWRKAFLRRWEWLLAKLHKTPPPPRAVFDRTYPPPLELARDLRAQVARGARLLFVWTGDREHEFNHREQFYEMLEAPDLRGRVQVELMADCDHLFSTGRQRARLYSLLVNWLLGGVPGGAASIRNTDSTP